MVPFSVLFAEEKTDEIYYNGKIINKYFAFDKLGYTKLKLRIVSINSKYRQAIVFSLIAFSGHISVNGKKVRVNKSAFPKVIFWEDLTPKEFTIEVDLFDGKIFICNGADPIGDKQYCKHLSDGAAIIIERLSENKFRCHCNDFENDDDFDDCIFDIEIVH